MPRKATQENEAETYREAAQEHSILATELHDAGHYVMAHYVAGLAVECILRAYRYRIGPVFDARHNLEALYAAADFGAVIAPDQEASVQTALAEVVRRWSNSHRFRSEQSLREYLKKANLGRTGKYVRESSRRIVNAAVVVVDQGELHWND